MPTADDVQHPSSPEDDVGPLSDPRYLEFFACFNRQQYFEAHEVLEQLWRETNSTDRDFYKALIQTAAVFLKLKQGKPEPARRLAQRALSHLANYEPTCHGLAIDRVAALLREVLHGEKLVTTGSPPQLNPHYP